jgi:protein-S-isoprenylcysteine O-methyltransferase Ste14
MLVLNNQNHKFYMSNTLGRLARRVGRWLAVNLVVGAGLFVITGRWQDPWLWAYVLTFSLVTLYALLSIDEDLARERSRPAGPGADRRPLRLIRLIALAHLIVGSLDLRFQITQVPATLRVGGLIGMAIFFTLVFRAMRANRFFSSVVRIQHERGHRVVDRGPYAIVRHPGYAGMIVGVPLSAVALGSWLAFAFALIYAGLILRRVLFEDAYLRSHLEGYRDYAERVRYRLIPGVW